MRHVRSFFERSRSARSESGLSVSRSTGRTGICEQLAQSTVEYALTAVALIGIVCVLAMLWRAGQDGVLAQLAQKAASHALDATGLLDTALF